MSEKEDNPCRLYLISPSSFDLANFAIQLNEALEAGDVACLQLRMKDATAEDILEAGEVLAPVCHAHDVAFIINDRVDMAKKLGAEGVHLGQTDGDIKEAREILGDDAAIGATCHNSIDLAFKAGEAGADYVAFGAFYPTKTKDSGYMAEPGILEAWDDIAEIPAVAIGGINVDNCMPLIKAGASFIAVCSAVWEHPSGAAEAVKAFNQVLNSEEKT
jgi:thiamine-phosphate pyrophosphorylase